MSDLPTRPPPAAPPLPPGWTEHKAPTGHTYYYNKDLKKSTYTRPIAEPAQAFNPPPPHSSSLGHTSFNAPSGNDYDLSSYNAQPTQDTFNPQRQLDDLIFGSAPKHFPRQHGNQRGGHRGGFRGGHSGFTDRKREQTDRPKHRQDIPHCAPWVLVKTKLGRRFVWNKDTNESFWKFPPNVMKAVIDFDRLEREKKERREQGEPSDVEDEAAMAEIEAELAAAEDEVEIVEVEGEEGMEDDEEYEEVEITDDEGEEDIGGPAKRQRIDEHESSANQPPPAEDDDLAWQLAQMEEMEMGQEFEEDANYEDEDFALGEEDCKTLFKELLDDTKVNPYTPWDKILENGVLYDDERYKALPNMAARKECFNEWARDKIQYLKEEKAKQQKRDPRIPYLALLDKHATPKLYWPEFRRKYKKEPEMKDIKVPDKEKEKLYREHVKRLAMRSSDLKSDLSSLLKAQPLALLNRSTTIDTLPSPVLTDIRYISLPPSTRNDLIESFISTLPPAPEGSGPSAEEEAERAKKRAERERREKALADRERKVMEEKRRQERNLAYGKGVLKEEEEEIERAMRVGKQGLKGHLDG